MEPRYYEDFQVGQEYVTEARTVTEEDVLRFAEVSGDHNPLHLDEAYARGSIFGERIAHGLLGLAMASGLLNQSRLTAGTLVAFLGLSWEFRRPVRFGDSLRVQLVVRELREVSGGRGIVTLGLTLVNQAGEVAQEGRFKVMVRKRAGG